MRRREFIATMGGVAALPFAARAQTMPKPAIGLLIASSSSNEPSGPVAGIHLAPYRRGLEIDQAVRMEYCYADNQYDRLQALAAEPVKIPADVGADKIGTVVAALAASADAGPPVMMTSRWRSTRWRPSRAGRIYR